LIRVVREIKPIQLTRPAGGPDKGKVMAFTPSEDGKLVPTGEVAELQDEDTFDLYSTAQDLARIYRVEAFDILSELRRVYPEGALTVGHYDELAKQIEEQTSRYKTIEETIEVALALVKKDGFDRAIDEKGNETYTAEISYPIDRERLLIHYEAWQSKAGKYGFHYTPYNFDSNPERNFFEVMLEMLKQKTDEVKDIYFTGALTDTKKTDFFIEYRGVDGRMHNYTPDFVIRRWDEKCLIVEIKSERERGNPVDGDAGAKAMATRAWADLNPNKLKYQILFAAGENISSADMLLARDFIQGEQSNG
jgi:type III restriction enzyme